MQLGEQIHCTVFKGIMAFTARKVQVYSSQVRFGSVWFNSGSIQFRSTEFRFNSIQIQFSSSQLSSGSIRSIKFKSIWFRFSSGQFNSDSIQFRLIQFRFNSVQVNWNQVQLGSGQFNSDSIWFRSSEFKSIRFRSIQFSPIQYHQYMLSSNVYPECNKDTRSTELALLVSSPFFRDTILGCKFRSSNDSFIQNSESILLWLTRKQLLFSIFANQSSGQLNSG